MHIFAEMRFSVIIRFLLTFYSSCGSFMVVLAKNFNALRAVKVYGFKWLSGLWMSEFYNGHGSKHL